MPTVDPFVPIHGQSPHSHGKSVPRRSQPLPSIHSQHQSTKSQPTTKEKHLQKKSQPQTRENSNRQTTFIILGTLSIGLVLRMQTVGVFIIFIYAILAFIRHIESRFSFLLALFLFLYIVMTLLIQNNTTIPAHFALYIFLLLSIGTISLARELHEGDS